jgi:hypothetical protein
MLISLPLSENFGLMGKEKKGNKVCVWGGGAEIYGSTINSPAAL